MTARDWLLAAAINAAGFAVAWWVSQQDRGLPKRWWRR